MKGKSGKSPASYTEGKSPAEAPASEEPLESLFQYLSVEYNEVEPHWKKFAKGNHSIEYIDQKRLDNAIWRAWHMHYELGIDTPYMQFEARSLDEYMKGAPRSVVLEGAYWKRNNVRSVIIDYMKFRKWYHTKKKNELLEEKKKKEEPAKKRKSQTSGRKLKKGRSSSTKKASYVGEANKSMFSSWSENDVGMSNSSMAVDTTPSLSNKMVIDTPIQPSLGNLLRSNFEVPSTSITPNSSFLTGFEMQANSLPHIQPGMSPEMFFAFQSMMMAAQQSGGYGPGTPFNASLPNFGGNFNMQVGSGFVGSSNGSSGSNFQSSSAPDISSDKTSMFKDGRPIKKESKDGQKKSDDPNSKRSAHIAAEQKRRNNINSGFDDLQNLVPGCQSSRPQQKFSKATILQKGIEYIEVLSRHKAAIDSETEKLKMDIEALKLNISQMQQAMQADSFNQTEISSAKKMYEDYVKKYSSQNIKFWIFSTITDRLFETFNENVTVTSLESLSASVFAWIEHCCQLPTLRSSIMVSMRTLCSTLFNSSTVQPSPNFPPTLQQPSPSSSQNLDGLGLDLS
eukprot:Nk52_evm6s598 gene=Nk52_evmTU6s598